MRGVRGVLTAGILLLAAASAAPIRRGDDKGKEKEKEKEKVEWKSEPAYKALQSLEARVLAPLMHAALKEDFRRQAWYLADRILAAKPGDAEASAVLEKWTDTELSEGRAPGAEFEAKRNKALAEMGDQYAKFGESLNGAGVDPEQYYELIVLAHSYGSTYGALLAAMEAAGTAWLGTFLDAEKKTLDETVGPRWPKMTFPLPCDDAYLKVRVRWPEAKAAVLGPWRLISDLKAPEALRLLATLEDAREHLVELLGGGPPTETQLVDVVVFSESAVYEKIAPRLVPERDVKDVLARSAWYERQQGRVLACWRDRVNPWIGADAVVLSEAAKVMARRHFGQGAGGWVMGRGAWLLDGLGGALEGLVVDPKTGAAEIDPTHCWRLAAARSLRGLGVLLSWDKFLEVDAPKAKDWPKRTVDLNFRGAKYEAKDVDVPAAQATALVVGLLKMDKGKGAKRLGEIVRDLIKRDSLPDLDKILGGKRGRWQAEAEKAIDAATGL